MRKIVCDRCSKDIVSEKEVIEVRMSFPPENTTITNAPRTDSYNELCRSCASDIQRELLPRI